MPIITTLVTRRLPSRRLAVGPVIEAIARHHDLADDLAGGEVAHQPLRAGVAERAGQRAADLRGNAQRAAVGFGNIDALDLMRLLEGIAARQPQQPFAGAVVGDLLGDHFGPVDGKMLLQLGCAFPWRRWSSRRRSLAPRKYIQCQSCCVRILRCDGATPISPRRSAISARDSPISDGFAGGT